MAIAKGKLKGFRAPDPITEQEVWWVELPNQFPEASEADSEAINHAQATISGTDPESKENDPEHAEVALGTASYARIVGSGIGPEAVRDDPEHMEAIPKALKQALEMVEKLHRENLELAGRVGWAMGQLESTRAQLTQAHQRIALLEAPKVDAPVPTEESAHKPWWRFW